METIGFVGVGKDTATPLLDRAVELYQRCIDMGYGESHDVGVMIDVINSFHARRPDGNQVQEEKTA